MAAIDAAFAPALKNAGRLGAVGFGDLRQILVGVRQAFSHVVHGPPEPGPTGESLDMLRQQRIDARNAGTDTLGHPLAEAPGADDPTDPESLDIPPAPTPALDPLA